MKQKNYSAEDIFRRQEKRTHEVKSWDRRRLARAYGKVCSKCGNQGRISDPESGREKPCPKCRHRRERG